MFSIVDDISVDGEATDRRLGCDWFGLYGEDGREGAGREMISRVAVTCIHLDIPIYIAPVRMR